ncbi:MAG: hypothetical protein GY714_21675, partial [Desulfobacterales bacterium]|nr:hypothetical protein [Desulfobacterales bacterium]
WNLGEDKAKFLSKRGCRKRKKLQVKKKVSRKRRKLSDEKKSQSLEKSASQKPKRKLPNKKLSAKKKKSKMEKQGEKNSNKGNKEKKLVQRYLLPDELLFEKFLIERTGYRINPIKRDGNCLFRAVADQVFGDPREHAAIRNMCANHMEENPAFFYEFVKYLNPEFKQYISNLRRDGEWGGDPEITALSEILNSPIEVYQNSEIPRTVKTAINGNNTLRLFYKNNHYGSIRIDGLGQLFAFEGLEAGELEKQMKLIDDAHNFQVSFDSLPHHSAADDQQTALAIEQSKKIQESYDNYLKFYASRIILKVPNEQN